MTINCLHRKSHDTPQTTLEKIQKEKKELEELLSNKLSTFKQDVVNAVLQDIKKNGLLLGNRWKISEEGTGSYEALVFRDMVATQDRRYAMFKEKSVDL